MPMALPDGYTIDLVTKALNTEFFGYANPKGLASRAVTNGNGDKIEMPTVLPAVQLNQASAQQSIYDGQTLVLFLKPEQMVFDGQDEKAQQRIAASIQKGPEKSGNKVLIALVTATLIDPVGNRVHSTPKCPSPKRTSSWP